MIASESLKNIIAKYDLYHAKTLFDEEISVDISFNNDVKITIDETTEIFDNDHYFNKIIFPRIIIHILTKNKPFKVTKKGKNLVLKSKSNKETITINNASEENISLIETLGNVLEEGRLDKNEEIDFQGPNYKYVRYVINSIAEDYALYRKEFLDETGKIDFFNFFSSSSYLNEENRYVEKNLKNLVTLEVARNIYALGFLSPISDDLFTYLENELNSDDLVKDVCNEYKKVDLLKDSIYTKALMCAEYEELNSAIIVDNSDTVLEALEAVKENVTYLDDNYEKYLKGKIKYYELLGDEKLEEISKEFLNNNLEESSEGETNMANKNGLLDELKEFREEDMNEHKFFTVEDLDAWKEEGEKEARLLMEELTKERDEIRRDAEEYAKLILKKQQENKEIIKAAEEQAKRIIELEKQNDELKKMAEENSNVISKSKKGISMDNDVNIADLIKRIDRKLSDLKDSREQVKFIINPEDEKEMTKAAEESAHKLMELEEENNEIIKMAEENARELFENEMNDTDHTIEELVKKIDKKIDELQKHEEEEKMERERREKGRGKIDLDDDIDIQELIAKIDEKLEELRDGDKNPNKYIVSSEEEGKLVRAAEQYAKLIFDREKERKEIEDAAEDQAWRIVELERENAQLRAQAEENAKHIFEKEEGDSRALVHAAEEQAKRIIELERENDELKRLAKENAMSIFNRDNRYEEELRLREGIDNTPVSKNDIDKILNLYNSLTEVEGLEFAINHPTIMQDINELEEKITTYVSTHKNVVDEPKVEAVTTETEDTTLPINNVDTIRNAYVGSMAYLREGRHTVINVEETEDKYKVSLYSVKDDMYDTLTEVFFEKEFFTEDVIKDICEIFKKDSVIIASKVDNIPNGYQDYLVIDNLENALRFMGVKKEIVEIAKNYA